MTDKEKSQTGNSENPIADISGDLRSIYNHANINLSANVSNASGDLSLDLSYVNALKQIFPEYKGVNGYRIKHDLINNRDGELDKVTTQLLSIRAKNDNSLKEKIEEDDKYYKQAYNNVKSHVKKTLLRDTITGKSISNSIIDRKLKIYETDLKKNRGSISWRNNNPLNMMYTSMSDELQNKLKESGVQFSRSDSSNQDGTFAKFNSYEDGLKAARTAIREQHSDSTVDSMLKKWSNSGYDSSILDKEYGDKKVSELSNTQLDRVIKRMQKHEGWEVGQDEPVPLEDYKKYIQDNPEEFQGFGIVDQDGKLIFDNLDDEDKSLLGQIRSDKKLHRKLLEYRYKDFEEALNNSNNNTSVINANPSLKAQSFSVFDKFGREGLTKFVNILQYKELKETSPQTLRESLEWYQKNDVGRVKERFMGKGENQISFIPPKQKLDAVYQVPKDLNNFTAMQYKFNDKEEKFERVSDKQIVKNLFEKYGGHIQTKGKNLDQKLKEADESWWDEKTKIDAHISNWLSPSKEEAIEEVEKYEKSGLFLTSTYDSMLHGILDYHRDNNSIKDLIKTVQANGQASGKNRWIIDSENADRMTKVAIDALNKDDQYGSLVYPDSKGNLILDLERMDKVSGKVNEMVMESLSNTGAFDYKLNPETEKFEKVVSDDFNLFTDWSQLQNTLETANIGAVQFVDKYFVGPAMEHMASAFRTAKNITGSETAEEVANFLDFHAQSDVVEGFNSIELDGDDLNVVNEGGMVPYVTGQVTPFIQMLGSIYTKGRGTLEGAAGLARGLSTVTKHGKAMSGLGASKYLKGSKFETLLSRWDKAQKANKFWTYGGTFYLGDAVHEMSLPAKETFVNYGTKIYDDQIEHYTGQNSDVNQDYRAANGITRVGLDLLGSFALSGLADIVIGSMRYAKDKAIIKSHNKEGFLSKAFKEERPTLQTDFESGKRVFKKLDKPQWRTDWGEFKYGITQDLDKWAIKDATSAYRKDILKKGTEELKEKDLTSVVRGTMKSMNELIDDNLKDDIKQTVRHYSEMFGGKLSDDQIERITQERYKGFIDDLGKGFYEFLSGANKKNPDSLPFKFADIFEKGATSVKYVTNRAGKKLMSLEEANSLIAKNPFRIKKKVGDGYIVKEIKENSWAIELGASIRKASFRDDIENILKKERELSSKSLTPKREEQLREVWHDLHGRRVSDGDEVGYITDIGSNTGFKMINENGEVIDNVAIKRFDDAPEDVQEYIKSRNPSKNVDEATEKPDNLKYDTKESVPEGPRRLGAEDTAAREERIKGEIQRIDQELARLEQKKKGIREIQGQEGRGQVAKITQQQSKLVDEKNKRTRDLTYLYIEDPSLQANRAKNANIAKTLYDVSLETAKIQKGKKNAVNFIKAFDELRTTQPKDDALKAPFNSAKRNKYGYRDKVLKFFGKLKSSKNNKPTFTMVGKAARNFGLDDERAVHLVRETSSGKEKRLFGKKNVGPIKEWDEKKATKNGVPKDVLVKRTNRDGVQEFFLTNKKTTLEPTRWVKTDNGIRINPDWDKLGINQTIEDGNVKMFIREEIDGQPLYREAGEDETGEVLLNVQNPTETKGYLKDEDIVSRGVDAYKREINGKKYYELISEEDQAFKPDEVLNGHTREGIPKEKGSIDNQKDLILKDVRMAGLGKGLIRPAVMGGGLSWVGDWIDDEDSDFWATTGLTLGLALGYKPTRQVLNNVFYKGTKKSADGFEALYKKTAKLEEEWDKYAEYKEVFNPTGEFRAKEYKSWFMKLADGIKGAAKMGEDVSRAITENRLVQSSFSFLEKYNDIPAVRGLQKLLLNVEHTPNEMKSKLSLKFNELMGDRQAYQRMSDPITKEIDGQEVRFEGGEQERFAKELIEKFKLGKVATGSSLKSPTQMKTQDYIDFVDQQISRVMNSGARYLDNGQYIRSNNPVSEQLYENAARNSDMSKDMLERLDRALIDDEYFGNYVKAKREWFKEYKQEWLSLLGKKISDTAGIVNPVNKELANKLKGTSLDIKDFKKSLDDDELLQFDKARKGANRDGAFVELIELKKRKDKFLDLGETYYPQVWSSKKFRQMEERYINDYLENNKGATPRDAKNAFMNKVLKDWKELNDGNPSVLQKYDLDKEEVVEQTFESRARAKGELRNIINNSDRLTLEERQQLLQEPVLDNMVQKTEVTHTTKDGTTEVLDQYKIRQPEAIRENFDLFKNQNEQAYNEFFDIISSGAMVKNSNFLEKPRKYTLPSYVAEHSTDGITYRYTTDVGRKLHFARQGVFMESDIKKEYLGKIYKGLNDRLAKQFDDPNQAEEMAEKYYNRFLDIYRQQTGIVHELRQFRNVKDRKTYMDRKIRRSKMANTARNLIGAGYTYGISFYDIFQHMIMSPILASWGSHGKTLSVMKNTNAAKRMEDIGINLHYADQKMKTFLPEVGSFERASTSSNIDWWYGFSKKAIDYGSNFSFTKKLGEKTGWFNVEDFGAYRIFTDGFYGVNQTATNLNALTHLHEAERLAKIGREIKDDLANGGNGIIRKGGKDYNIGDVKRQLEQVGIFRDEFDDFIESNRKINELIDYIRNGEGRGLTLDDLTQDPKAYKYIQRIAETATDSYHGRNKMFRPESWNSDTGRLLGQYSFYPMNFALQTTQRRIRQPIKQWTEKYGDQLKDQDYPVMRMVWNLRQGDKGLAKLKKLGLSDEAINDIPIDAYTTAIKTITGGTGLTLAMTLTKDGFNDIVDMAMQELGGLITGRRPDYEPFEEARKNLVMNPYAAEKHQRTLGEVVSDPEMKDIGKMMGWMLSITSDMGTFGKYGNTLFRSSRFSGNTPMDLSPVTREAQNIYETSMKSMGEWQQKGLDNVPETMGKGLYDFVMPKIPVLGSMTSLRKTGREAIFNKPKNRGSSGVTFNLEGQTFGTEGMTFERY